MEIGARIDLVGDAGGDDAEDGGGALAANVEPGEEPIFATETEPAQFTLAAIIRELDVAVFEEQGEAMPLPVEVAERATEWSLRWNEPAVLVEPGSEFVDDRFAELLPSRAPHFGGVAGEGGSALDLEQRGDEVQAVACHAHGQGRRGALGRAPGAVARGLGLRRHPRALLLELEERSESFELNGKFYSAFTWSSPEKGGWVSEEFRLSINLGGVHLCPLAVGHIKKGALWPDDETLEQLANAFEQLVEGLLRDYLTRLQVALPLLSDLAPKLLKSHTRKSAELLLSSDRLPFRVVERNVVANLHACMQSSTRGYNFNMDAFPGDGVDVAAGGSRSRGQ